MYLSKTEDSVADETGLSITLSETQKTGFVPSKPHLEKTRLRGFRQSKFQTSFLSYRD